MNYRRSVFIFLFLLVLPSVAFGAAIKVQEGDTGEKVTFIQERLKVNAYYEGATDGRFNSSVTKAVKAFQRKNGLKPDGVVDDKTYQLLENMPKGTGVGQKVSDSARKYIGVPYKFGGTTAKGFDCSGLVQKVFQEQGIKVPRMADEQFKYGKSVLRTTLLQPGDVVFFTTYEKGASHCGIYMGNNKFLHASSSRGVMISGLDETYWKPRYLGAKRFV
ncbi:C40 family peptidase [Azotosporobacter soli]|uniref:C40 family peptidase n=1 Tax=Azotosporobacter soli TaxID=3055040 RepID=UPI0031FEB09C